MSKTIKVRIYPDGKVSAETHGIKGQKCADYIQVLEKLLQAKTVNSEFTDEYYQTEEQIEQTGKESPNEVRLKNRGN